MLEKIIPYFTQVVSFLCTKLIEWVKDMSEVEALMDAAAYERSYAE